MRFTELKSCCAAGEDMWHAYNLIREGDAVTATTFRKVQKDSGGTSAVASERIKIKLTIKVEEVDFDAEGAVPSRPHPPCRPPALPPLPPALPCTST